MKLFLIEANTVLEGHRRLFERVNEVNSDSVEHVFLVPDRFTLGVERELVSGCFPNGYSNADVASFTRFAVKKVGAKIKKCLTKEGTVILLKRIMEENGEKLRYYKHLTGYGFAKELFAAIASLRSAGIEFDEIEAKIPDVEGVLGDKLRDIALIGKEYDRVLRENFTDTITRIDSLIEHIKGEDLSKTHFYILGFNIYSEQQLKLIRSLLKSSASVSMAVVGNVGNQTEGLAEFCEINGIPVIRERAYEVIRSPFNELARRIFSADNTAKGSVAPQDRVFLFSEETPYAEVLAAAREIARLVRRENYRYKDIAVVCNDASILPVVRETFERCEIPCFLDEGYPVADSLLFRYVNILLSAAERYNQNDFFKLMRHPFLGLDREDCEIFRKYCIKYNINYRRFAEPFTLGECERAEITRRLIYNKVASTPLAGSVAKFSDYIKGIADDDFVKEVLDRYGDSEDERERAAASCEQFINLLEELKLLSGDTETVLSDFSATLRAAVADMRTVLSPDYFDAVFVGNTEESRFSEVRALFVLGAADGFFPIKSGDGLIFSAMDNEYMRRNGMTVFPSPMEKNDLERFVARDLITRAEKLYIGCAETDLAGDEQSMGEVFSEIAYLTGIVPKKMEETVGLQGEELLNYKLVNIPNSYYEYVSGNVPDEYRKAVGDMLREKGLLRDTDCRERGFPFEGLFAMDGDGNFMTSVSQLETYFTCPFKHFMRYGLKAKEDEDTTLRPAALGTAIHNILDSFFRKYLKRIYDGGDFIMEIRAECNREFNKPDYERYFNDPVSAHLIGGVKKECEYLIPELIENMRASDFRPDGFEVGFGYRNDDNMILIDVDNRHFRLCGKIDRVDRKDNDIVIIDYKTGSVKPDLKDVWSGRKIQLYIYMKYFTEKGNRFAGLFYLPIRSGNTSSGRSYAMVGQMRDDYDLYLAMDKRAKGETKYVSPALSFEIETDKNGTTGIKKNANLLSENGYDNISAYVDRLVKKALEEIMDGYAERKPLKDSCKYCDYRRMCDDLPEREIGKATVSSFILSEEGIE